MCQKFGDFEVGRLETKWNRSIFFHLAEGMEPLKLDYLIVSGWLSVVLKLKLLVYHNQRMGLKYISSRVWRALYPQLPEGELNGMQYIKKMIHFSAVGAIFLQSLYVCSVSHFQECV